MLSALNFFPLTYHPIFSPRPHFFFLSETFLSFLAFISFLLHSTKTFREKVFALENLDFFTARQEKGFHCCICTIKNILRVKVAEQNSLGKKSMFLEKLKAENIFAVKSNGGAFPNHADPSMFLK